EQGISSAAYQRNEPQFKSLRKGGGLASWRAAARRGGPARETSMNLTGMLESTARKYPSKEALVYGEQRFTYTEVLAASRRAANVLRDAGVGPGDRVAVMTYNTPGF